MFRLFASVLLCASPWLAATEFSGVAALEHTRTIVAFGPRTPDSEGMHKTRTWLKAQLKPLGCEVLEDAFTASTPSGPVPMTNLIARFKGSTRRALAFTGHYDTKQIKGIRFLGANDGGASAGFLLELAHSLSGRKSKHDLYLVWFDGEEAYETWSDKDSLYGSRHLAEKWAAEGLLSRVDALINVDMIGDRDLDILQEHHSSQSLQRLVWNSAHALGQDKHFLSWGGAVEDDHVPFLRKGVRVLDLIDFNYGPANAWWHTVEDTVDKLDAHSFQVVGKVLLETLQRLD